jgi:plastocyanin
MYIVFMIKLSAIICLCLVFIFTPAAVSAQTYYDLRPGTIYYQAPGMTVYMYPGGINYSTQYEPYYYQGQHQDDTQERYQYDPGTHYYDNSQRQNQDYYYEDNSKQEYYTNSVSIENFQFGPSEIVVPVGTTVTWTNYDSAPHTSTSDSSQGQTWDSGTLNQGQSFSMTFNEPGDYSYFCQLHPEMRGVIRVVADEEYDQAQDYYYMQQDDSRYHTPQGVSQEYYYYQNSQTPMIYYQSQPSDYQNFYLNMLEYCRRVARQIQSGYQHYNPPI